MAVMAWAAPGVTFPETVVMEGHTLQKNGSGTREKFWIDLYRAALYLPAKTHDASRIIRADEPQLLRLVIVSSFISEKTMRKGIEEGFEKATDKETAPLQKRIDRFVAAFASGIQKGDRYDLFYRPGSGVEVKKNGEIITTIPGKDFKEALLAIWLGDKPAQKSLKEDLLGY